MADTVRTTAVLLASLADSAARNSSTRQIVRDIIVSLDLRPGFAQADSGHQILIGVGATVNAGQVSTKPALSIGEGAIAWGDGAIAIGKGQTAGQTAAKDGCISIGSGGTANAKNAIRIGSELAFGASAGDDSVVIGTQSTGASTAIGCVAIGRGVTGGARSVAIGYGAITQAADCIAIGNGAGAPNTGVTMFVVVIGKGASASITSPGAGSAIAIGTGASATGWSSIAIGEGAAVTGAAVLHSIALGHGATTTLSGEFVVGDNIAGPITLMSIKSGVAALVLHRSGTTGWGIRNNANTLSLLTVDESIVAEDVRLNVYDVTAAGLKRVTRGAADSGGVGYRALRVLN